MKKKLPLLIIIVLLVACCLCSIVGVVLFGNFESNGSCTYAGPLATKTGACIKNTSSSNSSSSTISDAMSSTSSKSSSSSVNTLGLKQYNGKNSTEYTFSYPSRFIIDDSSTILFVYSRDPKTATSGTFNDNLNVVSQKSYSVIDESACKDYAKTVSSSLQSSFTVESSSVMSTIVDIGNYTGVCKASWNAELRGIKFTQSQYVISDKASNSTYILTVSTSRDSSNLDDFSKVVNTFEIK